MKIMHINMNIKKQKNAYADVIKFCLCAVKLN